METQGMDAIIAELQKHRTDVHQRVAVVQQELGSLERELARLDSALLALMGESPKAAIALKAKAARKTSDAPSAKKAHVIEVMRRILVAKQPLQASDLKAEVETELTRAGFNRSGFAMRFKEAVQDPRFLGSEAGIRLAEPALPQRSAAKEGSAAGDARKPSATSTATAQTATDR